MNNFQKKESQTIHRIIGNMTIPLQMEANYKSVRRNMRRIARLNEKMARTYPADLLAGTDPGVFRHVYPSIDCSHYREKIWVKEGEND